MLARVSQKARGIFCFPKGLLQKAWKRRQRILGLIVFVFLVLVTLLFASYVLPSTYQEFSYGDALRVILGSPASLSLGDEEEILVTVVNTNDRTFSEVFVQLAYSGDVPLASGLKGGNSLKFKGLMPEERRSGRIKVRPLFRFYALGQNIRLLWNPLWVEFDVKVGINEQPPEAIGEYPLILAPVPRIRWLFGTFGAFTFSPLIKRLQDWLKAAL